MVEIKQSHNKEIIALDTFEAVRLRPTMYLGQVAPMDDKLPIIRNNILNQVDKKWSPGFMHLIIEILENAIDEAKRMKGKMKNSWVTVNVDNNEVTVQDEGDGFHKANAKHSKTYYFDGSIGQLLPPDSSTYFCWKTVKVYPS